MRAPELEALRCSFCHKAQGAVQKLISSPSDYPRTYICDECISVCVAILEDERQPSGSDAGGVSSDAGDATEEPHPLLTHPRISTLLGAIERWIRQESLNGSGAEELAELRHIARAMMSTEGKN